MLFSLIVNVSAFWIVKQKCFVFDLIWQIGHSVCVCVWCVGCWCCLVCVKCQHLLSLSCDDKLLWSACFHFVYPQQWTAWAGIWHGVPNGTLFVFVWYSLCPCVILSLSLCGTVFVLVWYSLCPCVILSLSLCGTLSLCDTVFVLVWYSLCPCVILSLSPCGTLFVLVWYSLCPCVILSLSLCGTYCLCPCVVLTVFVLVWSLS